jgi:hypothetical protein
MGAPADLPTAFSAMNTILCLLVTIAAVVVGVLLWATETQTDRARRWHRSGLSQAKIADRLGVSRYRVRRMLAG